MSSIWDIRRSATDVKLAGLCGGVARHWGVDPVLVRVGWALLALSGGIGLVLYVAGWLLIPIEGRDRATIDDLLGEQAGRWPREAWIAIVVLACIITFAFFGTITGFGFGPAVVLAVIWYFGYYKNRRRTQPNPPSAAPPPPDGSAASSPPPSIVVAQPFRYPGPPSAFTDAAETWRQRVEEMARERSDVPPAAPPRPEPTVVYPAYQPPTTASAAQWEPVDDADAERTAFLATPDPVGLYTEPAATSVAVAPSRRTQAQSRSARRLRLVSLVVLGLTLAALGITDTLGVNVPVPAYVAGALLVVGLTLVAATWLGRARGILPVGLLLLVALVATSVTTAPLVPEDWNQRVAYSQVAALPAAGDDQRFGKLTVDLRDLPVTRATSYRAHVGTGSLEVLAPTDVNVLVRYRTQAGVVFVNGTEVLSGDDLSGELPPATRKPGEPTLTLDLTVDLGELRVSR